MQLFKSSIGDEEPLETMNIKKHYFLFVCMSILSISGFAQVQIEGFWGVNLGDRESYVVSKIKNQFPDSKYEIYEGKNQFCVNNASYAGFDTGSCFLRFTNGIFTWAKIPLGIHVSEVTYSQIESTINMLAPTIDSKYQEIVQILASKYGMPISTNLSSLWRSSNGNSITVSKVVRTYDTLSMNNTWFVQMLIEVVYSKGSNDF